ncbi:MAG: hypothetical protein WC677_00355 [Clostridia bacterium]
MKKLIVLLLTVSLIAMCFPITASASNVPSVAGTAVSGTEYSGTMALDNVSNPIPVRYNLNVAQNSIIRIFLYTQQQDSNLYIGSPDNPYSAGTNGIVEFSGYPITLIGDFYDPAIKVISSSRFSVSADKRNTLSYTEMFSNVAKGNYFIDLTGYTYRFKIIVYPLKYKDDFTGGTTETVSTAASYTLGSVREGNMIFNGPTNNIFPDNYYDWYKFTVKTPGNYTLSFSNDGFLQCNVSILDNNGYYFTDASKSSFETVFPATDTSGIFATFDNHVSGARTLTKTIKIAKAGTYKIKIAQRAWTSGSYKFSIKAPVVLKKIVPAKNTVYMKVGAKTTNAITAIYSNNTKKTVTTAVSLKASNKYVAVYKTTSIRAVKKGTTVITATYKGIKTTYKVIVK